MALIGLAGLWLLFSGLFKPLLLAFGLFSVGVVFWLLRRAEAIDETPLRLPIAPHRLASYLLWLMAEIARANWAVTKLILAPRIRLRQHLFALPCSQTTDVGQVIFANSITLTPGTITVETEPGRLLVHAVDFGADDLKDLAEMDARVRAVETVRAAPAGGPGAAEGRAG